MVLGARFKSMSLKLLNPYSSHYAMLPSTGVYESCLIWDFWTKHGLLHASVFFCLKQASPHLSSLHTALLSSSRRVCDNEWAPSARCLDSFEERQPGNAKYGDGGLCKGGWWVETSWHFKWQHQKGSGIFLRHRQEIDLELLRHQLSVGGDKTCLGWCCTNAAETPETDNYPETLDIWRALGALDHLDSSSPH